MQVQMTKKEIKTVVKTITIELSELQAVELAALLGQCRSEQSISLFKRLWDCGVTCDKRYNTYMREFEGLVDCPTLTNI